MKQKCFNIYVWFYLFLNIIVILGGAYVRATGSGAGCGTHWPLCQGVVLPNLKILNTFIEFMHRISSAVVGVGALALFFGAMAIYPKKHHVRFAAGAVLFFVILEALLGAGLVLFGLVADNTSYTRIVVMGLHLVNTFLLLGAITLTAGWSSGFGFSRTFYMRWTCLTSLFLLLLTGVTGAITALSDTVFKPEYLGQNLFEDILNPTHVLQLLRAVHPVLAIFTSVFLAVAIVNNGFEKGKVKILGLCLLGIICVQIFVGLSNLVFLTPIALQLLHLFIADVLWIVAILYFTAFAEHSVQQSFDQNNKTTILQ